MNGACYFEIEPWEKICKNVMEEEGYDSIISVSIQSICKTNNVKTILKEWEDKLLLILGGISQNNIISHNNILSAVQIYSNGAIVRLFIDGGNFNPNENIEVVTKESLYIWKPDSHPQGHIELKSSPLYICSQLYSDGLAKL